MNELLRKWQPLLIGYAVFWMSLISLMLISLLMTDGILIYDLDDPYIHFALAENFAKYGVWGVYPTEYASASSSILYDLILAGLISIFGSISLVFISLILNIILSHLFLGIFFWVLQPIHLPVKKEGLLLALVVPFVCIPTLVLSGMEHIFQLVIDATVFKFTLDRIGSPDIGQKKWMRQDFWIIGLSPLMTLIRFEGMFLVAIVALLYLLRKKVPQAFLIGITGLLPVAIFALFNISQGGFFLPNSVIVKSVIWNQFYTNYGVVAFKPLINLVITPALFLLFILGSLIIYIETIRKKQFWSRTNIGAFIFVGTAILQVTLASVGWFFRYEAYLIVIGIIVWADYSQNYTPGFKNDQPDREYKRLFKICSVIAIIFLSERGVQSYLQTPPASANIYWQQYQVASFIHRYYDTDSIARDDIGYVNYLSNGYVLDLCGLSTPAVAEAILARNYTTETIEYLCMIYHVKIAVVLLSQFDGINYPRLPFTWVKVGDWTIPYVIMIPNATVTFFAVDPLENSTLKSRLVEFAPELPSVIQVQYYI